MKLALPLGEADNSMFVMYHYARLHLWQQKLSALRSVVPEHNEATTARNLSKQKQAGPLGIAPAAIGCFRKSFKKRVGSKLRNLTLFCIATRI